MVTGQNLLKPDVFRTVISIDGFFQAKFGHSDEIKNLKSCNLKSKII